MKLTTIAFALFALCAGANAQTVTVPDVEAVPGETVAFVLNLTDGKANTYTAMQFDAQFPSTGFNTTGDYTVSNLWKNAMATIGTIDAGGVATIPVASSEAISATDVEGLLSVSFTVGSDVVVGEYDVTLTNLWFGYGTSSKDYLEDVTFKVNVVAKHTIVLNENSETAPSDAKGVNVKVKRTIKADTWSTICLPFAMTEEQVKEAFGDDVELADFTSWSSEEDDEGDIVNIELNFTTIEAIEMNHPCLIKVSSAVSEFNVDNVDIDAEEEPSVQVGKKKAERGFLTGTYVANTVVPENNLFLSGNKFYYSTGNTKTKAFRAYFELADVLTEVENAEARIRFFVGEEADGIINVSAEPTRAEGVYTLQGVALGEKNVKSLPKGIYIVNGKKVVKD